MLEETSRTFYIPISRLPGGLQQAVGSAYLCLRAIDEIEDHADLSGEIKARLLRNISRVIQSSSERLRAEDLLLSTAEFRPVLAEVTLSQPDWLTIAPHSIASRIWTRPRLADRMADWEAITSGSRARPTSTVIRWGSPRGRAGAIRPVGLVRRDAVRPDVAVGFGAAQAVNILRNRMVDFRRGVDFFPTGWEAKEMQAYARRNLSQADEYLSSLPPGPAFDFCRIRCCWRTRRWMPSSRAGRSWSGAK